MLCLIIIELSQLGVKIKSKDEGGQIGTYAAGRGFYSTFQTAKEFGIIKEYPVFI